MNKKICNFAYKIKEKWKIRQRKKQLILVF